MSPAELAIELAPLKALSAKLAGGEALTSDEAASLVSMVDTVHDRKIDEWRAERLQEAVDVLFPGYDGRMDEERKPPRWPDRSWWWNGATISSSYEVQDGVHVSLSSYVGRGNTDEYEMVIPSAWLERDDMEDYLRKLCLEKAVDAQRLAALAEIARARADVDRAAAATAAAKDKLKKLSGF